MITSTKVQAQVKQFQQFDIAVENFKTMYGQLPGDTEYYTTTDGGGCVSAPGDNDGTIENENDDLGATLDLATCEIAGFWSHLSQNGFGSTAFSQTTGNGIRPDDDTPAPKLGKGVGIVLAYGISGTNYYHMFDVSTGNDEGIDSVNAPSLTASNALALDSKMDDSVANTGDIIAIGDADDISDAISNAAAGSAGCVITGNLGTYNVTYSSAEICFLRINMLSQTTN